MDWRTIQQHPIGAKYRKMSAERYERLCLSVAISGPQDAVVLYKKVVLDHWHLFQACIKTGKKPKFWTFRGTEEEARRFACCRNACGRMMSDAEQIEHVLECYGDELKQQAAERKKA